MKSQTSVVSGCIKFIPASKPLIIFEEFPPSIIIRLCSAIVDIDLWKVAEYLTHDSVKICDLASQQRKPNLHASKLSKLITSLVLTLLWLFYEYLNCALQLTKTNST